MTQLTDLPAKPRAPYGHAAAVNAPWRYLVGAHGSVQILLTTFDEVRAKVAENRGDARGTLKHEEQELLRAALVFTSSGLDASMHALARAALPRLIAKGGGAAQRYEAWLKRALEARAATPQRVVEAILDADPKAALVEAYVETVTSGSYQGSSDLRDRLRAALCLKERDVPNTTLSALDPFFAARNAIVHDMDYENVKDPTRVSRNHRSSAATLGECDRVFQVCAAFIDRTAAAL